MSLLDPAKLGLQAGAPSILFLGETKEAFEAIAPLLACLVGGEQRADCFLSARDPRLLQWLRERFEDIPAVPPPYDFGPLAEGYLRRQKVRAVVLLEREAVLTPAYARHLQKRAIPLLMISGRGRDHLEPANRAGYRPELLVAIETDSGEGPPSDRNVQILPSNTQPMDAESTEELLKLLLPYAGRNVKWANRGDRPLRRWFGERLFEVMARPALSARLRRFVTRLDSTASLADFLGRPETILCLGNGPSSEDSRLQDMAHDALFRVNHSWMERPFFTDADVIFTGGKSTMRAAKSTPLGLQDELGEKALLMTRGPGMFQKPVRYFVMSRLGDFLTDFDWGPHRPTNGASMIAMAVALQPKRLIIAGIDLFQHPAGSYPGDQRTPNAYTPAHTVDKELAFIFLHLDQFTGEVVIIGDALDREWRKHSGT